MSVKSRPTRSGRIVYVNHVSKVLADNALADPHERSFPIYLPAQYDLPRNKHRRFPVLYDLVGYTGSGHSHVNWRNFEENVPEQLDRLIEQRKMPPCIVVFPDCFTSLGGNQYINSSAIGRYADYLTRELIPFVDQQLRTHAQREQRACFGKSSGGYGAIMHGMKYPQYWGAVANHSGDAYFDFVYASEWPAVLTALQKYAPKTPRRGTKAGHDDGRVRAFLDYMAHQPHPSGGDVMALMMICMAATYDPSPKAPNGFYIPYDLHSGERIEQRWKVWLKHDPIHLVGQHKDALRSLKGIFIDCGRQDQFHIHYGSRQLSQALQKHRIRHRYEEFDGTHSGVDYRMDISLPFLARCLSR